MSNDRRLQIRHRKDGTLDCDEQTTAVLKAMAAELTPVLVRPVIPYAVGIGLLTYGKAEIERNERLFVCVDWVLDRLQEQPERLISRSEVRRISQPRHLPKQLKPRIGMLAGGTLGFTGNAVPLLHRAAGRLQTMLEMPVEIHHVAFAFLRVLGDGCQFVISPAVFDNPQFLGKVAAELRRQHGILGHLPQLHDEAQSDVTEK